MVILASLLGGLLVVGLLAIYMYEELSKDKPIDVSTLQKGDIVYYVDLNGIKRVGQLKSRNKELVVKWLRGEGWITLDLLLRDLKLSNINLQRL